jgi:Malectin domain
MRRKSHTQRYAIIAIAYAVVILLHVQFRAVVAEPAVTPVRVNIGGDTTTDSHGNIWEADDTNKYYNTGNVVWACPKSISNTEDDVVYCTYRWFNQIGTPYRYTFPQIPQGAFVVRLHFAELYVTYPLSQLHLNISFF